MYKILRVQFPSICILIIASLITCSCSNSISSADELSKAINGKTFLNSKLDDEYDSYLFKNNQFTEICTNKRTGEERKYYGSFKVKKSIYLDNAEDFYYLKLDGTSRNTYLVYSDGELIIPYHDGNIAQEDATGLYLPEWHISQAQEFLKFKQEK